MFFRNHLLSAFQTRRRPSERRRDGKTLGVGRAMRLGRRFYRAALAPPRGMSLYQGGSKRGAILCTAWS